jgi:2-polyprenyl-6-methoxyphenol hydroxylase-like FAD-dependent oxidoreductase
LNPAAGVGAITAMHDAVALANWIATLQTNDRDDLNVIFKEYYDERYPIAKAGYTTSQMFSRLGAKVSNVIQDDCTPFGRIYILTFFVYQPCRASWALSLKPCSRMLLPGFGEGL